jgi:hypothetical protein
VSSSSRLLAWGILIVWFSWIHVVEEQLMRSEALALATPDLGMVLFVGLLGSIDKKNIFLLALLAALARKSFSIDPGIAILSGFLALAWLAVILRSMVELSSPMWRAALAAVGAGGLAFWLEVVRYTRGGIVPPQLEPLLPIAFTSCLAALALGSFVIRLPGLSPLRRKSW